MSLFQYETLYVFLVVGLILVVVCSIIAIKLTNQYGKIIGSPMRHSSCSESLIEKLDETSSPSLKADIFLQLMQTGYVLVHKQINEGNKYSDSKQTERFKLSLTTDVIQSINEIEGKDLC